MNTIKRGLGWLAVVCMAGWTVACSTAQLSVAPSPALDSQASWALLPVTNHTDTPQAGLAAEALLAHALRSRGLGQLQTYPLALTKDTLFEPTERKVTEEALKWAKAQGIRFAVTGSVQEWRYKVGIDGEPAVGMALQVVDVASGAVLWTASGARSGWSREALSGVAQGMVTQLVSGLSLTAVAAAP